MNEYKTVHKEAYDEFTEKRSRFIGYACPVKTLMRQMLLFQG